MGPGPTQGLRVEKPDAHDGHPHAAGREVPLVQQEPQIRLELRLTERVGPLMIVLGDVLDGPQICCLRPGGHPMQNQRLLHPLA
jgi:hypothetical protein